MATDLQNRPDEDVDPIQHAYDQEFNRLTSPEHWDQDGGNPNNLETVRDAEEGSGGSFFNPGGDKAASSNSAGVKTDKLHDGLYNDVGDDPKGTLGKARNRMSSLKAAAGRNKLLVGGMIGGSGLAFGFFLLLILIAGSLKIPHLAQNITLYQFARLTRQYAASAESITAEKAALDAIPATATSDSRYAAAKARYTNTTGKVKDTFSKLEDKYSPSKAVGNLQTQNSLKYNYERNKFGRLQLKSVTINGNQTVVVKPGYTRFVPVYGSYLDFKNNIQLSRDFGRDVQASLKANEVAPIVRGAAAKQIREKLGIGLVAWKLGNYEGKDAKAARIQNVKDLNNAKRGSILPDEPSTKPLKEGVAEVAEEETAVMASDERIAAAISNGGVDSTVRSTIGNVLKKSGVTSVLGFINPIYGVALPMCIVYDGSMNKAGPTIDNAVAQQQATYYYIAAAADQEKNGSTPDNGTTELATAVQGLNDNLGDVSESNAVIRANSGAANTESSLSAEASAGGNYTLLDALVGGPAAEAINYVGDNLCPVLTDTKVVVGIGVVNVVATFFTGGAAGAAEKAGGVAAEQVTNKVASNIATRLVERAIAAKTRTKAILFDATKSTAKIVGATLLAKMIVMNKASETNSSLAQGADLANIADAGGNLAAGEISRQGMYGRALTDTEIAQSNQSDKLYLASLNQSSSPFDRYFSTDNANSLTSKMAMSIGSNFSGSIIRSMTHAMSTLFRPATLLAPFNHLFAGAAEAETTTSITYNNIQFGWSKSEEQLINSSTSYKMLENQLTLDNSGLEDKINEHYGKCFTETLGTLLSEGDIRRDEEGNVISGGLCSPQNLGPNNTDADGGCGAGGCGDLVFRWRLAHRYETVLQQLDGLSNVSTNT